MRNRVAATLGRSPSPLGRIRPAHALVGIAVAAMLLVARPVVDQPRFVGRISFDNPTAYDLTIDVSGPDGQGWMAVADARRNAVTLVEEVYDIGDVWVFRISGQGRDAGEVRITRARLEGDGWRVSVPAVVGDELRHQGAPPPP